MSEQCLLMTGATGAVGQEVMGRLAKNFPKAIVLGRTPPAKLPVGWQFQNCDLSKAQLAIEAPQKTLAPVTHVLHSAADVRWNLTDPQALQVNTFGTNTLVDMVQRYSKKFQHFIYVSTAYVDNVSHKKNPYELAARQGFNNSYEYSKYLAELYLQSCRIPSTIIRPSIIVGRATDGRIQNFNGIYQLINLWARGMLPFVLGGRQSKLDLVPVDLVAEAIDWSLLTPNESVGRVIYCSSGHYALNLLDLVHAFFEYFNNFRVKRGQQAMTPVSIVDPNTFERLYLPIIKGCLSPTYKKMMYVFKYFIPYLSISSTREFQSYEKAFICQDPKAVIEPCLDYWFLHQGQKLLG